MSGAFRGFQRSNKPLSSYLDQRYTVPALDAVAAMNLDELSDPDALVQRMVAARHVAPPSIGEGRFAGEGLGEHRPDETGSVSRPTVRQRVRYLVDGDVEALAWWPDKANETDEVAGGRESDGLTAVDDDVAFADRSSSAGPAPDADLRDYRARLESQRWVVAADNDPQRARGLHTYLECLEADLDQIRAGELDLGAELQTQFARVAPIVAAIAQQHRQFFRTRLPAVLRDAVLQRRRRLEGLQAARNSIGFPADWKAPEPQLAEPDHPAHSEEPATELALPVGLPSRLADASFDQVLQTVRVWADAVEQHPEAYRQLNEDRISDLLVVTLNTALPRAGREVFSRKGKTDIFIRADALSLGRGPEKIFVGENKKYNGPTATSRALNQLMGYLEVRDTKALLLLLVNRQDFQRCRDAATTALQDRADFAGHAASPVEGWPVLRFHRGESTAQVCLAMVNIAASPALPGDGPPSGLSPSAASWPEGLADEQPSTRRSTIDENS